MAEIFAISCY